MKTALNVAGIALVIAEYCMLMADKPVIAGLAGLMAVATLIPIWIDERHMAVRDSRRTQTPHGICFPAGGLLVAKPTASLPYAPSRRPALRPVRPARAA